jgi:glucose-1-phosphate thymidylyltransferase
VGDPVLVRRYSSVVTDNDGRITRLEEKPEHPETLLAGVALYFYPAETIPLIRRYLAEDNNPDQPGRLVEWLYTRTPVYTWRVPGRWIDIGSQETLREADKAAAGEQ